MRALLAGQRAGLLALGLLLAAAPAAAQRGDRPADRADDEPTEEDVENARELFRTGLEAVEEERWEEARTLFERSYELVPRASTLLNLAAAQAETGRLVAAAASYRRFLEETADDRRARRFRPGAEQELATIESRITHVTLTMEGLRPDDSTELDGQAIAVGTMGGATGSEVPMDPGQHVLVVRRHGTEIGRVELVLVEGESRGVTVPLRDVPEVNEDLLAEPPSEEMDLMPIWVGVGVGAAVIAIGVAIGLGVAFGGEQPYVGNLGPGMVTF